MKSMLARRKDEMDGLLQNNGARSFLSTHNISAFQGFTPPDAYPSGVELFKQGSPADQVFFIASGLVKLSYLSEDGQAIIIALRFPGWVLGVAPVLLEKSHPVTGKTLTQCQLASMGAEIFRRLLKTDEQFAARIQMIQSLEVYQQVVRISQLACFSAQDRLEQLISQLMSILELDRSSSAVRLRLPMKQVEIAELIAVTPEHLSVLLKRMEQQGIIRREKGWLIIPDAKRFSSIANE